MFNKKSKEEEELSFFIKMKNLLNSPDGETLLNYLKGICYYNYTTFNTHEQRDVSQYREGRRSVLLNILAIKEIDINQHREFLLKEANKIKEEQPWEQQA